VGEAGEAGEAGEGGTVWELVLIYKRTGIE
jgi:hypothetical protein